MKGLIVSSYPWTERSQAICIPAYSGMPQSRILVDGTLREAICEVMERIPRVLQRDSYIIYGEASATLSFREIEAAYRESASQSMS